jgi:ATP-dependent RNA helicase DeaD
MRFEELSINPRLKETAKRKGFDELTEIQAKSMVPILEGKDVVGQAETGSGKTVAFSLPLLERIKPGGGPKVLVLTPTRELCVQVADVFSDFGNTVGIKTTTVYGGVGLVPQIKEMRTADIIVATPGRLLDHIGRGNVSLVRIKHLVLDETDKMFEMGFIEDVEEIITHVPKERQTLMFSATISYDIQTIVRRHLRNPVIFKTRSHVDNTKLSQVYYEIWEQNQKFSLLVHLLKHTTPGLAIVFCSTRRESDIVAKNLKRQGINAMAIHGGMTQHMRLKSLDALKNQRTDVLVATDVAARGLDIKNVTHVYNYDVPGTPKEYIHRIGRTARAGEDGDAVTLLTKRDHDNFRRVLADTKLDIEKAEMPEFKRVPFMRQTGYDNRGRGGGRGSGSRHGSDRKGGNRGNSGSRHSSSRTGSGSSYSSSRKRSPRRGGHASRSPARRAHAHR